MVGDNQVKLTVAKRLKCISTVATERRIQTEKRFIQPLSRSYLTTPHVTNASNPRIVKITLYWILPT